MHLQSLYETVFCVLIIIHMVMVQDTDVIYDNTAKSILFDILHRYA
jgi:hypothetical protein